MHTCKNKCTQSKNCEIITSFRMCDRCWQLLNVQLYNARSRTYVLYWRRGSSWLCDRDPWGFGLQVESLVSLGWCIRWGTRREGDEETDYLPPQTVTQEEGNLRKCNWSGQTVGHKPHKTYINSISENPTGYKCHTATRLGGYVSLVMTNFNFVWH